MTERTLPVRHSNIFKSSPENLSFLTKEDITDKHNRTIKISYVDLDPYLTK